MTDKERILMKIIHRLSLQYALKLKWGEKYDGVHFAPWIKGNILGDKLKPGMLVLCETSPLRGIHNWTVGFLHSPIPDGWAIKEIGSEKICNITNESFLPIVGFSKEELLIGEDYDFLQKIYKAFSRGGSYFYRFGGIKIIEKRKWKIYIREAFGGLGLDHGKEKSVPISFILRWNKKTSIKYILEKMIEAGYGTKEFERETI